jgi:hypothetical protein
VADAAHDAESDDHAREIVLEAVQRRLVRPADLRHELEAGARNGSRRVRLAVEDVEAGAWSVPEASVLVALRSSRLLPPAWPNPRLSMASGLRLPSPDAWFDDVALAVQVHSRRFHELGRDWERTVMRDGIFAACGVPVVAVTPSRIARDPAGVVRLVERAYLAARGRPRPDVLMQPRGPGVVG